MRLTPIDWLTRCASSRAAALVLDPAANGTTQGDPAAGKFLLRQAGRPGRELSRQADQRREGSYFHRRPLRTSLGPRTVGLTPGRPHHTSVRSRAVIAMSKTPSVLIADDEPNILLSLQFLMKKTGYEVRTAKDGEEALAEIVRAAPDLVLLDVMMPRIDGFSVCERIRANPEWNDVRIIMLTARGRDIEREKGLALGADDYITKPFSTKDAIARVEAVLARSRKA